LISRHFYLPVQISYKKAIQPSNPSIAPAAQQDRPEGKNTKHSYQHKRTQYGAIEGRGEDLVTDIDWIRTIMGSMFFFFFFFW
jgi:hypothetical protein